MNWKRKCMTLLCVTAVAVAAVSTLTVAPANHSDPPEPEATTETAVQDANVLAWTVHRAAPVPVAGTTLNLVPGQELRAERIGNHEWAMTVGAGAPFDIDEVVLAGALRTSARQTAWVVDGPVVYRERGSFAVGGRVPAEALCTVLAAFIAEGTHELWWVVSVDDDEVLVLADVLRANGHRA